MVAHDKGTLTQYCAFMWQKQHCTQCKFNQPLFFKRQLKATLIKRYITQISSEQTFLANKIQFKSVPKVDHSMAWQILYSVPVTLGKRDACWPITLEKGDYNHSFPNGLITYFPSKIICIGSIFQCSFSALSSTTNTNSWLNKVTVIDVGAVQQTLQRQLDHASISNFL